MTYFLFPFWDSLQLREACSLATRNYSRIASCLCGSRISGYSPRFFLPISIQKVLTSKQGKSIVDAQCTDVRRPSSLPCFLRPLWEKLAALNLKFHSGALPSTNLFTCFDDWTQMAAVDFGSVDFVQSLNPHCFLCGLGMYPCASMQVFRSDCQSLQSL